MAVAAAKEDITDLARNAPAARFIGEQVVRQIRSRCRGASGPAVRAMGGRVPESGPGDPAHQVADDVVGEPFPGYDVLTARQVVETLATCSTATRQAVLAYESIGRARRTVLEAAASSVGTESSGGA